jgi:glutaryl-CoA dehydrogenase
MGFEGLDFYELDEELHEDERLIRDNVRRFVDAEIIPVISQHFQAGTFPMDLIPKFADLGMLGANLKGYGCAGLGDVAYGLIMQELERGDSGIRSFCSVQGALCMYPIYAFGTEEQKTKWLPKMAKGEVIGCFGLTEPDFGSNPTGMITRADRLPGGGYRLNGRKRWITNGNIAKLAIIWAKLDGVVHGFLVPTSTPGFTAQKIEDKFSLRASVTSELILEDVEVGEDSILNVKGLKGPLSCLSQARAGIAFGVIGAAMACYDCALSYAKDRVQFSRPIAGYQLVQNKLVHMVTEITKAQLLSLRLMRLKEKKQATPVQISLAKRNNVFHALEIARMAREILGGNGIMFEYPIGRHMLNLETVITYEGTHDIHTLIVGQHITGISAFE